MMHIYVLLIKYIKSHEKETKVIVDVVVFCIADTARGHQLVNVE